MLIGRQTWRFQNNPQIITAGTVAGPVEKEGQLIDDIDVLHDDLWFSQKTFEKAQQLLMEDAAQLALSKAQLTTDDINFFISGDLTNQITPTTFAAKALNMPYFGLFSACATMTESLALSAYIVDHGGANYILSGTSSHHSAAERQFRNPTEYGGQKPPTAQTTVTGAACALIGSNKDGVPITTATIGKVIDYGVTDASNMGAAMAPAAVDTILTHLKERNVCASYYDLILTGDLGKVGHAIALEMLQKQRIKVSPANFKDCGLLIFKDDQPVLAGGSGPACAAIVTYGHYLKQLKDKNLNKILIVATGALHSPLSVDQGDSIPCIAHAISLENRGESS